MANFPAAAVVHSVAAVGSEGRGGSSTEKTGAPQPQKRRATATLVASAARQPKAAVAPGEELERCRAAQEASKRDSSAAPAPGHEGHIFLAKEEGRQGEKTQTSKAVPEKGELRGLVKWQRELEIRERILAGKEERLHERKKVLSRREIEVLALLDAARESEAEACLQRVEEKEQTLQRVIHEASSKDALLQEQVRILLEQERVEDKVQDRSLALIREGLSRIGQAGPDKASAMAVRTVADGRTARGGVYPCVMKGGIEERLNGSIEGRRMRDEEFDARGEQRCAALDAYDEENRSGNEVAEGGESEEEDFPEDAKLLGEAEAAEDGNIFVQDLGPVHVAEESPWKLDESSESNQVMEAARMQQMRAILSDG